MRQLSFMCAIIGAFMLHPLNIEAQKNENAKHEDSYYLVGAVPMENGKVVFKKEFNIPGMRKNEVFDKTKAWMDARMKKNENNSRVTYTNIDEGTIAAVGDEYLVFSQAALSLDRTKLAYLLSAKCEEEKCVLSISRIVYDYPGEKEKFKAEEWITDDWALNKDRTKLARGIAKFRRKTIDWVDDMNDGLQKALSGEVVDQQPVEEIHQSRKGNEVTVVKQKTETVAAATASANVTASVSANNDKHNVIEQQQAAVATKVASEGPAYVSEYLSISPAEVTTDMVQIGNGKLVIEIVADEFNKTTMTANAGGYLAKKDNKSTVSVILSPDQSFDALKNAKEFNVCFYPNGSRKPSVVMTCKNITTDEPINGRANIFTGEILSAEKLK